MTGVRRWWPVAEEAALWALAVVATLAVAAETKVGPVVHRISAGHGVHLGDVAFGLAALVGCALVSIDRHRRRRRRRQS